MDGFQLGGMMSGLGGLFGGLFGGKKPNPADAAMPYLNQMGANAGKFYNPFINSASQMSGGMNELYQSLMKDPSGFLSKIGQGYEKSPGYDFAMNEALRGSSNAAAAGGMLGSPEHEQRNAEVAQGLASKDYQDYLKNALGLFGTGVQGGENTMGRGFNAAQGMANTNNQMLSDLAQYAYAGQAGKNQQANQNWANIFGGAASLMPWLF